MTPTQLHLFNALRCIYNVGEQADGGDEMTLTTSQSHRRWALIHAYIDNNHGLWYYLTMESNSRMYLR